MTFEAYFFSAIVGQCPKAILIIVALSIISDVVSIIFWKICGRDEKESSKSFVCCFHRVEAESRGKKRAGKSNIPVT
jgi:hypothetical protein